MEKLRIGILGLGGIAKRMHIPILKGFDDVHIMAGAEVNPTQADRVKNLFHIPRIYSRYDELLLSEDLDAVYVCLPNHLHYDAIEKSFAREVHVFCEKPMGHSSEHLARLIHVAEEKNLVLMPGYQMKFRKVYGEAKGLINGGYLGKILQVQATFINPGPYSSWDPKSNWYVEDNGGALFDIGSHMLDLLDYLVDDSISEVSAQYISTMYGYKIPDNVTFTFKTEKNTVGSVNIGWRTGAFRVIVQLHGTASSIIIYDGQDLEHWLPRMDSLTRAKQHVLMSLRILSRVLKTTLVIGERQLQEYYDENRMFINAVKSRNSSDVGTQSAVRVLEVLEAVRESMLSGTVTKVRQHRAKKPD